MVATLDFYQEQAAEFAKYGETGGSAIPPSVYTVLGLNGEAGEVAEKIKKHYRDDIDPAVTREAVKKELGDTLWYLSETARQWDLKLSDVAQGNLDKLSDRAARGVLKGSGDNR